MKPMSITLCIFTNLIILGMCGYFYLLLTQYWSYWNKHIQFMHSKKSVYDKEIYYYNRGYPNETNENVQIILHSEVAKGSTTTKESEVDLPLHKRTSRHATLRYNDSVLIIKNNKPRFLNLQNSILELDTNKYKCLTKDDANCTEKTLNYKNKLLMELQRILMKEGDTFSTGVKSKNNPYNVRYTGVKEDFMKKSPKELVCKMRKNVHIETITRNNPPFNTDENSKYFPKRNMFFNKHFNSCAIIASAGSLLNSYLGSFIDSHDLVLRFNHAPTKSYEEHVGSKTTMRILNSQVVTKSQFGFLVSDMYSKAKLSILVWDPTNYSASLDDWYKNPEHDFFDNFKKFRDNKRRSKLYLLNPQSLWSIWDFLQSNTLNRLRKNPPSSGFLALAHLMNYCSYVDLFEYVPSVRITQKCHYYDTEDNPACTFGAWHPLAAEKLIAYAMNVANDYDVFQKGYIRIPGYSKVQC